MEERLRIARELHDVLAHHIALINVQAQVASHVLGTSPDQAREALDHVHEAGREALDELRTTVGLLRRPGTSEDLPTEPSPGLNHLPGLLASFDAAGMEVRRTTEGEPRPLSAQVELAAFRIAQEALTNVSKHAPGASATVRIAYVPNDLLVEIADDGPGGVALGTGHGLIGMRERALSVEGTFQAGSGPRGGFLVRAMLPAPEAIRVMHRGEALLSPRATKGLIGRFLSNPGASEQHVPPNLDVLTERELEVLALVAAGRTNDEIAEDLGISRMTSRTCSWSRRRRPR